MKKVIVLALILMSSISIDAQEKKVGTNDLHHSVFFTSLVIVTTL